MLRYEFTDMSIRHDDIHPEHVFDKERKMAHDFVRNIQMPKKILPCPVCNALRYEILFKKWGCAYAICPKSWSVALSFFPEKKILQDYYLYSELSRFRASEEYQGLLIQKRKHLWEGQIEWIEGRVSRYLGNEKYHVIDWGGKSVGWVKLLDASDFAESLSILEPLPPLNQSADIAKQADIVCMIDVLQRETNPLNLLRKVAARIKKGGLLIASCRSGSGFDVLTLRNESDSIFPFDHLFLPSPKGMKLLLEQAGLEILELCTPGLLDVRYVKNATQHIPKDQYFQRYLVEYADELVLERMQNFLQRNNLSSHLRFVAKKR